MDRELIDRFYSSLFDEERLAALLHTDTEWVNPEDAIEGGIRRGRQDFLAAVRSLRDTFEGLRYQIDSIEEGGAGTLVRCRALGRGRASGAAFERARWHVLTFEGTLLRRFEWFNGAREARAAAGLPDGLHGD